MLRVEYVDQKTIKSRTNPIKCLMLQARASAEKFPGEEVTKNSKKYQKNSTIKLLPGGRGVQQEKDRKIAKKVRK